MLRRILAHCVLLATIISCTDLALLDLRASGRAADSPGYWGFDTANLDKSCKPCDDFFQFAMGGFRGNGPLSNMAQFAQAFGCKKGDAMVREKICKIW